MICYQSWIPVTHESILVFQPTPRRARLHRHGDVDAGCDWRPYKPGYFIMIHHLSNKQRFHQSNVGCKQLEETFISSTLQFGTSSASCFLDLAVLAKRPDRTNITGRSGIIPPSKFMGTLEDGVSLVFGNKTHLWGSSTITTTLGIREVGKVSV